MKPKSINMSIVGIVNTKSECLVIITDEDK